MTMTPISQTTPEAPAADPILALAPQPETAVADRDFEKVFEKTASEEAPKKDKPEKPDSAKKVKAQPALVKPGTALSDAKGKVKAQQKHAEGTGEMAGQGHAHLAPANQAPVGKAPSAPREKSDPRAKVSRPDESKLVHPGKIISRKSPSKKADPNSGTKQTAGKISNEPTEKPAAKPSSEQSARVALKRAQAKQAAKTQARKEARVELKAEEKAKSAELRARNTPAKALSNLPASLAKSTANPQKTTAREGDAANGTQFAVNTDKMVMQAKQSAPSDEARPALVEELRPATSAELSSQAGSQQQDLPREQAKETPLPVTPVVTVAATGTGAAQAFAPSAGIITPLMEKIWTAVSTYRARGGDEVVVKIQPDAKTELELTIKYSKAGVEIQARMQQGDGQQLAMGWKELQQALTERGVSLSDLNRGDSVESDFDQTAQNFSKNSQNQAQNAELNLGDDRGDWSALGLKPKGENKTQPTRREPVLPVHDGWQSWA
jgi:hypothetical protein